MPLYFFHLCFADRTVPDDEGVELPDRSAARAEALAVIQDLSNPEVAGNPRRWASWFLQVADEGGELAASLRLNDPRRNRPGRPGRLPPDKGADQRRLFSRCHR